MAEWIPLVVFFLIIQQCHRDMVTLHVMHIINKHHQLILNVGICTNMIVVLFIFFCMLSFISIQIIIEFFYLEHVIETDYHAPPVGDFGYGRGGAGMDGYRDTFESWEGAGGGGGYAMNAMFTDGGLQTDYELSNINSVSMTPNGKYAIVGQSQGPPQIWDAVVRKKSFCIFPP
jgi:hypothetical protein